MERIELLGLNIINQNPHKSYKLCCVTMLTRSPMRLPIKSFAGPNNNVMRQLLIIHPGRQSPHKRHSSRYTTMGSTCSSGTGAVDVESIEQNTESAKSNDEKYKPTVIVGPSGVGKGTLLNALREQYPGSFSVAVSHTTRGPREGEENGVHYHFVSKEQFESDIADDKFIEHAGNYGNLYGTSKQAVADVAKEEKVCLLEIDVVGAQRIKESEMETNFLFITVDGEHEACKERIKARGQENAAQIDKRVEQCRSEFEFFKGNPEFFDASISNDDLTQASKELTDLFKQWYQWLPNPAPQNSDAL